MPRVRLFFLIRSLGRGGAERQLVELVKGLDKTRFQITVATFYAGGALEGELRAVDEVRWVDLQKRGRWDMAHFVGRLVAEVRSCRPDVLHGYMGVANELCLLVGRLTNTPVVWGVRSSFMDLDEYGWLSRVVFRVGARLSRHADLIIFNSSAGLDYHASKGVRCGSMEVVPNGIDTERFKPDPNARETIRSAWRLSPTTPLVGIVGRIDPMKDHATFLSAAALLARRRNDVRFVCVGSGDGAMQKKLRAHAAAHELGDRLLWEPARSDIADVYNGLDVLTSTSIGEGFPNVIGEAMATGVPVVATDVGDSAWIVGETGELVPPRSPTSIATAWEKTLARLAEQGASVRAAARQRIVEHFGVARLVSRTAALLEQAARPPRTTTQPR